MGLEESRKRLGESRRRGEFSDPSLEEVFEWFERCLGYVYRYVLRKEALVETLGLTGSKRNWQTANIRRSMSWTVD
jgi:hypothetical protein